MDSGRWGINRAKGLAKDTGNVQLPTRVHQQEAIESLCQLVEQERERIVRLWAKRLRSEVHQLDLPGAGTRKTLRELLDELARLLRTRGEDALRLWPELVRPHGGVRYDQRFEADDLGRELKAFQLALLHVYGRRHGYIDTKVAEAVAELVGEASAAVQACFARILRTEEVRFKEAALMESILHHVDIGILLAEVDGTVSYVTPGVGRLLGLPVRTILGVAGSRSLEACLAQVNARHPDGRPFKLSDMPFSAVLATGKEVPSAWMVFDRHPTGEEVIVEMTAIPVREQGLEGPLVGVVQTMSDRTESAHKTEELSSAYEELRRLQSKLLQRTRSQALGQLASGAAHALNNYLNVMRLRLKLLHKEAKPEHLDALDATVGQLGELVSRLQEFSFERAEEQLAEVDVDRLVREAIDMARGTLSAERAGVHVETELQPGARAKVDEPFMRELLLALMLVAGERLQDGGTLTVRSHVARPFVDVEVWHPGTPYTPEEAAELFDPLRPRAPSPYWALLLAIGRSTLLRWGGELAYEGAPSGEEGAFRVRLPLARAELPVPPPKAVAPLPKGRPSRARRVLVVDDDVDNAKVMAEVLAEEGYDVKVAHSAAEALAQWERAPFDAALLDALMPERSGWELARDLRERSSDVLLAVVTGADVRGQSRANLALVDAVFRKPVDVGALDDFLLRPPERVEGEPPLVHS
ncbi:MAG: response regulator [Myxococcota bacterium]